MAKMKRLLFLFAAFLIPAAFLAGCEDNPKTDIPLKPSAPAFASNIMEDGLPVWEIGYDGEAPFNVSVTITGKFDLLSLKVEQEVNGVTSIVETVTAFPDPMNYTYQRAFEVPDGTNSIKLKFTAVNTKDLTATATFTLTRTIELSVADQQAFLDAFAASYTAGNITASGLPSTITVGGEVYDKAEWFEIASRMMHSLIANGELRTVSLFGFSVDNPGNLALDNFVETTLTQAAIDRMATGQLAYAADLAEGNWKFANTLSGTTLGAYDPGRDDYYTLTVTSESAGLDPQAGNNPPFLALKFTQYMPYFFLTGPNLHLDWTKDTKVYIVFDYKTNDAVPIPISGVAFMPPGATEANPATAAFFSIPTNTGALVTMQGELTASLKTHYPDWNENGAYCFVPFVDETNSIYDKIYMEFDNFKIRVYLESVSEFSGDLSLERSLIILMRTFAYYKANSALPATISSSKEYVAL